MEGLPLVSVDLEIPLLRSSPYLFSGAETGPKGPTLWRWKPAARVVAGDPI